MATACLNDPLAAFERLEHDDIHQHYELQPGQKGVTARIRAKLGKSPIVITLRLCVVYWCQRNKEIR